MATDQHVPFKGRHFTSEVILWALHWDLAFPISYRDLALMLSDRGVVVDRTTLFRCVQAYAATLERRIRPHLRLCTGFWRVDETYTSRSKACGRICIALAQPHTVNPRTITVDKNPASLRWHSIGFAGETLAISARVRWLT